MKKTRAKKPAMPKAVHARTKRKASRPDALPDVAPVERPTDREPPAPALEVVGGKARRRLDRPSGKRFAGGGGVTRPGPSLSLAQASAGMTPDDLPRHPVPARIR